MEITGKVHCLFEQSGTFKNEFIKLGIPAEDYDLRNNFGETDHIIDLFAEIEAGHAGNPSLFDNIRGGDLVLAFFPCIYFCDAKTMTFKGVSIWQKTWSLDKVMDTNIEVAKERELYFRRLMQLVSVCAKRGIRLIIENPWNDSGETYLQRNFIKPTIIDKNRSLRGDYFVKPTAYWFVNCTNTMGQSYQPNREVKIVYKVKDKQPTKTGECSEERSLIHPDYARNFICDFILGVEQAHTIPTLF